jgi:solute carrier family 35 (GDP-fucose transporter), member C1
LSSLKSVFSAKYLTTLHYHPMQLLSKMAAYACVQMLILSWWTGEFDAILITYEQQSNPMLFFMILFSNGVMAFMLNLANFATTKKTSALTVTVGGNLKHMATIIISVIIFQNPISLLNGIGIALAAIGAAVYSYVEYTDKINSRINPTHDIHKGSLLAVNIDAKEARS